MRSAAALLLLSCVAGQNVGDSYDEALVDLFVEGLLNRAYSASPPDQTEDDSLEDTTLGKAASLNSAAVSSRSGLSVLPTMTSRMHGVPAVSNNYRVAPSGLADSSQQPFLAIRRLPGMTANAKALDAIVTRAEAPAGGIEISAAAEDFVKTPADFKAKTLLDPNMYKEAKEDRLGFWAARAKELEWFEPWTDVLEWKRPYAKWFVGGKMNAAYNCLDVHLATKGDKTAYIFEGEKGNVKKYTYKQLHAEVCKLAAKMSTELGVKKGDRVIIYMPMIPELAIATLACARIGAIHSVVFGGFSAKALQDRIEVTSPAAILTADGGYRRGKVISLKPAVDTALAALKGDNFKMPKVVVAKSLIDGDQPKEGPVAMESGRDFFLDELTADAPTDFPAEPMDSEDPLFILYSSGSTGKPKGIVHTTGGYMTHAKYSSRVVFDLRDDDVYWCTADVGWITGHTYLVYGPLANGATGVIFEGTPDYPGKDRWWDMIEKHKVSVFYTAPTAIRSFMKWGVEELQKHDLSSIRMLGSVGEPINPEAWRWYFEHVGGKRCPIADTWWQTETGGIMVSNLAALNDAKPGSAGLPLPGIEVEILGEDGKPVKSGGGFLSITKPWPSMIRGLWQDDARYEDAYWSRFETYFAGDGATIDDDGYIKVLGRVDDTLNVAGHRIGTMELESALVGAPGVAEAAIVAMPDELKFEVPVGFVILKEGVTGDDAKRKELNMAIRKDIGAIASPKYIVFTPELPKTRSGKIMRRILKNLLVGQSIGETSTLANPDIVNVLKEAMMDCDPDGFCDILAEKPPLAETK